jgi:hypothetical protein
MYITECEQSIQMQMCLTLHTYSLRNLLMAIYNISRQCTFTHQAPGPGGRVSCDD